MEAKQIHDQDVMKHLGPGNNLFLVKWFPQNSIVCTVNVRAGRKTKVVPRPVKGEQCADGKVRGYTFHNKAKSSMAPCSAFSIYSSDPET